MNITDSNFQIESSLMLPEDEVQLWRADLEAIGVDESRWQQVLSSDELTRASRFHFSRDRQRFVAGRALLRTILAGYLRTQNRPSGSSAIRAIGSKRIGSRHPVCRKRTRGGCLAPRCNLA